MSLVDRKNHDLEGSLVDEVAIRWPKTRDDCFAARGFALPIHRRRKSTSSGKVGSLFSRALFDNADISDAATKYASFSGHRSLPVSFSILHKPNLFTDK